MQSSPLRPDMNTELRLVALDQMVGYVDAVALAKRAENLNLVG